MSSMTVLFKALRIYARSVHHLHGHKRLDYATGW